MQNVEKIIQEKLNDIERHENVKILHCVESGSRAWGFPSPDSDYDVRFIYVRPKEYYLKLDKTRDVIEWQLDDTLDINGWDLQKMLRLLHGSNPTVFEWENSPIVYRTSDDWDKVAKVIDDYFNPKKGMYHYLSMAKRTYNEHIKKEKVKLKKYFYALRPILACEHIRKTKQAPPMLFKDLLVYLESDVKAEVLKLLELKEKTSELGENAPIKCIDEYIERKIEEFECYVSTEEFNSEKNWHSLNELFMAMVL